MNDQLCPKGHGWLSLDGTCSACERKIREALKQERDSCMECDSLAKHGFNDGPCPLHANPPQP